MEFLERVRWTNETPAIYVNYYYEYQRDGANMKYRVKVVVEPVTGQRYFGYPINIKVTSEGVDRQTAQIKGNSPSQWSSNIEWTSDWWIVSNKVTGTTSLALNMTSNNRNQTNYYNLAVAPAYTSVSTWSVASKTETSITLNWATAHTCSSIRYGKANNDYTTASVNASSGQVTISGLTAGQTYTLYFMPCRKDSGLWGDGSADNWKTLANQQTHPNPYATGMPNFNIESPVTITIANPLGRECTVTMLDVNNNVVGSRTTTGTTVTGFNEVAEYTALYNSIPSANNAKYKIKVEKTQGGSSSVTSSAVGTYSVVNSLCNPDFSDFRFFDDDYDIVDLTGNNQYVVPRYSDVAVIISEANKAEAQKGATMSKYQIIIGTALDEVAYSSQMDVSKVINNAPSGEITVYAIDSRGVSTAVTKSAAAVKNYTDIQRGSISVERQSNIGEETTLSFSGTFWNENFGDVQNDIVEVKYRYKKTNESWPVPEVWNGQTQIVPTKNGNDYSFSNTIKGDLSTGFDVSYSYNIEVMVTDKLSSTVFSVTLGSGRPNMAISENGVSINGKYDDQLDDGLQVNGKIYLNGVEMGGVDIPQQPTAPSNPSTDDLWIDTDDVTYQLQVDSAVSTTSHNPIENQAITNYVKPYIDDTGWVDLSSYVNTANFAIRSDSAQFKPMARRIGKVVFWKGAIYCHTTLNQEQGTLLTNIPQQFMPNREVAGCGNHYNLNRIFSIWTEGRDIKVNEGYSVPSTNFWQGYSLSCLGPYTID